MTLLQNCTACKNEKQHHHIEYLYIYIYIYFFISNTFYWYQKRDTLVHRECTRGQQFKYKNYKNQGAYSVPILKELCIDWEVNFRKQEGPIYKAKKMFVLVRDENFDTLSLITVVFTKESYKSKYVQDNRLQPRVRKSY